MTTLLVLTAGHADVQLIVEGGRRELDKGRCAALHDEIERRGYVLGSAPDEKGKSIDALPEGELQLCVPRLDAVLREERPSAALVLETRRNSSAAPDDPRFAGAVIESRLNAQGVGTVYRCAYLQGGERNLEDRDKPRDAVIRRDVVQRVEGAVRDAIEAAKPTRIVVAATGGFPRVSNLVEEIVRLHASVPVESLEIADGTRAMPVGPDRAVVRTSIPEPLVSFQARRRALDLLERGNLLGAWAVAEPLQNDEVEQQWTRVVEWLKCFASSMPIDEECDLPILRHKRMAVRAALRVELALRAGDIPKAVHGTVAFFEAALWDWLRERDFAHEDGASGDSEHGFHFTSAPEGEKKNRFRNRNGVWRINDFRKGIDAWLTVLNRPKLNALWCALSDDIRDLRNDVAHNEPTPELMADARQQMQAASLWSTSGTFLSEPLAQAVLRELGESEPGKLLEQLLAEVRRRLVAPIAMRPAP